jgi:hypothetical protein
VQKIDKTFDNWRIPCLVDAHVCHLGDEINVLRVVVVDALVGARLCVQHGADEAGVAANLAETEQEHENVMRLHVLANLAQGRGTGAGGLGRDSPIFLQFFYLFSIFFLNCF